METIFILSSILLSIAISLGVGSSTIAVTNFFMAIADGTIEPTERRMMGVTYWVLRAAMVLIALMLIMQYMLGYAGVETPYFASTHAIAMGALTVVLYVNAVAMTYRLMPSTFGPAIQASSWYTLGVTAALVPLGITSFSLVVFFLAYIATFALFLSLINGIMGWLRHRELEQNVQS
ncbi:hypothetical protein CL655_03290 [bacterium]|nr:hypothetical protein [bacterium]|tara:strand:+ start:18 stop:548 length:531 start_codon:yes stop_codon:yes gene_type:complete